MHGKDTETAKAFNIKGFEVHAHRLTIENFFELKSMFSDWQTLDHTDLLISHGLKAFSVMLWMGTREDTQTMQHLETVERVVTIQNQFVWFPVLAYIMSQKFVIETPETYAGIHMETPLVDTREVLTVQDGDIQDQLKSDKVAKLGKV